MLDEVDRHERRSELLKASAFTDLAEVDGGEAEALDQRGDLSVCAAVVARKKDDPPTSMLRRIGCQHSAE